MTTILETLENTLEFLEILGYTHGDVHDNLVLSINKLKSMDRDLTEALNSLRKNE